MAFSLLVAAPFVGSFLATLVLRLPRGEPVAWARSYCRGCGGQLTARELVPLLSWIVQRGRCTRCAAAIPFLHPAMELAALAIAGWAVAVVPDPAQAAAGCVLGWMLLTLAAIDQGHFILPDVLTLPLIALGLLWRAADPSVAVADGLIGAMAGFAILYLAAVGYRLLRGRDGLGMGDAKLLGAIGAWTGWQALPVVLLGASLLGLAIALASRRHRLAEAVPWGPHLALAGWLAWLYGI